MFKYYNANPYGRHVNDCSVRAISLAQNQSWEEAFTELSEYAKREGITFSEVEFINDYLAKRYERFCVDRKKFYTIKDFLNLKIPGVFLITMLGHITCVIDGVIYDTSDCSDRCFWCIYRVK